MSPLPVSHFLSLCLSVSQTVASFLIFLVIVQFIDLFTLAQCCSSVKNEEKTTETGEKEGSEK